MKQRPTKIATIDGSAFLNMFRLVSVGADVKSAFVDGHVLLTTRSDGTVEMRSSRTGSSFKYLLRNQRVFVEISFTLGVKDFNKRMNAVRDTVDISIFQNTIIFTSENLTFSVQSLDPEDFATDMTTRMVPLASFSSAEFARYLRLTSATIDSRYHLPIGGLWLRSKPGGLILTGVAEMHGGTRCEVDADVEGEPLNIIIPKPMVSAMLVGLAYDSKDVRVELLQTPNRNQLGIRIGDAFVSGQMLAWDHFPSIDDLPKKEIVASCRVNRGEVSDILNLIVASWDGTPPARAIFKFGRTLLCISSLNGNETNRIATNLDGDPSKVQLNAKQLRSTASDLRSDLIQFGVIDPGYVVVTDPSDAKYIHVAMPIGGSFSRVEEDEVEFDKAA